jgi:proline iminopeptidase
MRRLIRLLALALPFAGSAWSAEFPPAKFVNSPDGARIAYYAFVDAKTVPLLILSGGPGSDSRYMWARGALHELARSRTLVSYDQRGTSQSSDSNGGETIDKYVEDIEAIRKAVGAPKIDLLGHSFGGYLAMAYTSRHADRVRGLIFVDSSAPKLGEVTQLMAQLFPDRIEEWRAKRATLGKTVHAADLVVFQSMEFVDSVALEQFLQAVSRHRGNMEVNNTLRADMAERDYWDDVRRFEQPALVIHGRFDAVIAASNSWTLHHALRNSTFRIVEAAGHLPHIERPDAFLAIVKPFLEGLDR